ncbi:MAG TPA: hypothetical protein VMW24_21320 [Sedimentisphaerales bacterium]|nr:hypothetical protein [Sedimentisphaerales bacterium]
MIEMREAYDVVWDVLLHNLFRAMLHNREAQFWAELKTLRETLDGLIDGEMPVVATIGVSVPAPESKQASQTAVERHASAPAQEIVALRASCEFCKSWKRAPGRGQREVCRNHDCRHWMVHTGAGEHCGEFERRT